MSVFVDTSAILAGLDKTDQHHGSATATWTDLLRGDEPLITTNYLDPQGSLGKRQRRVAIHRRVAATDYAARDRGRAVHPRELPVEAVRVQQLRATALSLRAIAAQTGCSVATVGRRLGQVFPSDCRPKYRRGRHDGAAGG